VDASRVPRLLRSALARLRRVPWLYERTRSGVAGAAMTATAILVVTLDDGVVTTPDASVILLLAYLLVYWASTALAFSLAAPERIREWAAREERGSFAQRYLYGSAPGPGVSLVIAAGALTVAVWWLPDDGVSTLPPTARTAVAFALVVLAWASVVVSFAVAFHADNLVEDEQALAFPHQPHPGWSDYVYFAVGVMTTFGSTDVTVTSAAMRRTVTTNAVLAFVFNTVIVATLVSALAGL